MKPTFLELFAGAGGMSRGIEAGGFHCIGHSEIEPNARAVLRYRYPDVPLYGDVTKVTGEQTGPCDLVSFGAPCQDLSVAGKRAGLMGARSSLFFEGVRLWQETGATYALYENVMGALSSNAGKDFATVLSTLVGATIPVPADGWASGGVAAGRDAVAAWRVLDLQHFGPPQRRVRVFVLAARAGGVDPAEVLALSEGVCGHPSPRQQAREGTAGRAAGGVGAGGVIRYTASRFAQYEVGVGQLRAAGGDLGGGSETILAFHHTQTPISGDVSPAIGRTTDGMGVMAFAQNQRGELRTSDVAVQLTAGGGKPGQGYASVVCATGDITHALTHEDADASEGGTGRGTPIVARMVAFGEYATDGTASTIKQRDYKDATDLVIGGRPRRLTPRECEALMSWPTNWTQYGRKDDGTVYELSDTARYRLCGNGVGSVCVEWIATRLADAIAQQNGLPMQEAA